MTYRISVFGSANPQPGSEPYQAAQKLGTMLGNAGYTVLTGGYSGTMEATSRGAAEAGGHVIGVTCDEVEQWRSRPPNKWIKEKIHKSTLRERLNILVDDCDAAIALPGGIGTLTEIALMWNSMQINALPDRPLILVGTEWQKTFTTLFKHASLYIRTEDHNFLQLAPSIDDAFQVLQQSLV
jgi:uncharacterized protein (TIGR00730 family)